MFLGLGTMLERFFEARSRIQHVPKSIQVPKTTSFDILQNHVSMCVMLVYCAYMHVLQYVYVLQDALYVCNIAMYCILWRCRRAMYYSYEYSYLSYVLQLCIIAIFHRCIITTQRSKVALYTRSHTSSTVKDSYVRQKPYELKGLRQSEAI